MAREATDISRTARCRGRGRVLTTGLKGRRGSLGIWGKHPRVQSRPTRARSFAAGLPSSQKEHKVTCVLQEPLRGAQSQSPGRAKPHVPRDAGPHPGRDSGTPAVETHNQNHLVTARTRGQCRAGAARGATSREHMPRRPREQSRDTALSRSHFFQLKMTRVARRHPDPNLCSRCQNPGGSAHCDVHRRPGGHIRECRGRWDRCPLSVTTAPKHTGLNKPRVGRKPSRAQGSLGVRRSSPGRATPWPAGADRQRGAQAR